MKDLAPIISPEEISGKLIPVLKEFVGDSNAYVRTSLAEAILSVCTLIGKKPTEEQVIPLFLSLLKDDAPEVRLGLFKNLGSLNSVVPLEGMHAHILPVFQELASDKNWRLRLQAMDIFYLLATHMADTFLKQPQSIKYLSDWLGDKYFSVREGAVDLLYRLCKALGTGFLEKNALPLLLAFQNNHNYLYRLTLLFGVSVRPIRLFKN